MVDKQMSKAISDIFDVDHVPSSNPLVDNLMKNFTPTVVESNNQVAEVDNADSDILLAQDNLKSLMQLAKDSLGEAIEVATVSEQPRAWEVVTGMINASADLSTRLIDSHSTKQKMKRDAAGKVQDATGSITNNNLFVGTPSELSKLLKGQNGSI